MTQRPVLIFDGDCGFCTRTANAVKRLDTQQRFDVLPWQTRGLLAASGLNEQQVTEAAWYIDAEGRKHRGAGAINTALNALGGIYRIASWVYRVPGLKQVEDLIYKWVARNRYLMPGSTAACAIPSPTQKAQSASDSPAPLR